MFQKSAPQIKGTSLPFTHINGVISIFSSLAISGGLNCLASQNNTHLSKGTSDLKPNSAQSKGRHYFPLFIGFVVGVSSRKTPSD